MELEVGLEDLLNKRRIESDRIEFKTGWNPDDTYRSVHLPMILTMMVVDILLSVLKRRMVLQYARLRAYPKRC